MTQGQTGNGYGLSQLPNLITVLRIAAVGPLAWLLWIREYPEALIVAFVAGASDGIDGFLAKRYDWESRLGGLLDPLADKLLLVTCFTVLAIQGHLPVWLLLLVIGRDVVIVTGGTFYHFLIRPVDGEPTLISKVNTFLQIALVLWVLLDLAWLQLPYGGRQVMILGVAATTVASGFHYVWVWGIKAWQTGRGDR